MAEKVDPKRQAQGRRLQQARIAAGYRSARQAALENRWPESTYRTHEAGTRTIGDDDAERYARRYRKEGVNITAQMILFGDNAPTRPAKGSRVSLDKMVEEWDDEMVRRAAEALKLLRPPSER